jgi:hypothetical protein
MAKKSYQALLEELKQVKKENEALKQVATVKRFLTVKTFTIDCETFNQMIKESTTLADFFNKNETLIEKEDVATPKQETSKATPNETPKKEPSKKQENKKQDKKDLSWHCENCANSLNIETKVASSIIYTIHKKMNSEKSYNQYIDYITKMNNKTSLDVVNYYKNNNLSALFKK